MTDIKKSQDEIETAIILAMSACRKGESGKRRVEKTDRGMDRELVEMDGFVTDKDRRPTSFYAFDMSSGGSRLYTHGHEDLVLNPRTVFAHGIEQGFLCEDGSFKWAAFYPMKKPKGIVPITNKPVAWFAQHFRHIWPSGQEKYVKESVPLHEDGTVPLCRIMGGWMGYNARKHQEEITDQVCMAVSFFEDAVRANSYLATVEEDVKMMFPVGAEAYKEFFSMRDGYKNTPTGRKNPILHWCAKYIREEPSEKRVEVKKHTRGASEFVCGHMKLTIKENEGYEKWLSKAA